MRRYLRDFVAQGRRAGSVWSYAYDLLRWWRWLQVVDVEWDQVTSAQVREFVLWLERRSADAAVRSAVATEASLAEQHRAAEEERAAAEPRAELGVGQWPRVRVQERGAAPCSRCVAPVGPG
ncbi:site-specific integrase [Streptomyces sp. NPDC056479]|uniref:site-specific integrase n=1 Tax=Streptomyces sp. NPDC056479 TaxID=3345832 RepID=UPI0036C4E444